MIPQCFGLIRELFGDEGQQKAFAVFGPVMGLSAVLGPVIGGGLVDLDLLGTGWRAIFLVNVPIGIAAIALGLRHLPAHAPAAPGARVDLVSVGHGHGGWCRARLPARRGPRAGLARLVLRLIRRRRRRCSPSSAAGRRRLRRPRAARRARRSCAAAPTCAGSRLVVCFIGAMGGMVLVLNVMLQAGLGFSPLGCGVATIAVPVLAIFGSITSSVTLARLGRTTIHIGTATMAAGLVVATSSCARGAPS